VTLSEDEAPMPLAFRLGHRQYKIVERLAHWRTTPSPPSQAGAPAARWYLHRRLGTAVAREEPEAIERAAP
jgi:hypothetical protein